MKKFIILLLTSLVLIQNTFAYDLNEKDKQNLDKINQKIEKIISEKGESYRSLLVTKLNKLAKDKNNEKLNAFIAYIVGKIDIKNLMDSSISLKKELKIENYNVVLYENGKKVKNLTNDGNFSEYNKDCKLGELLIWYNIVSKNSNFVLLSNNSSICEGDGSIQYYLFDLNKGIKMINLYDLKLNKLGILNLGDPIGIEVKVEGQKLKIYGDFLYNICEDRGCPAYLSRSSDLSKIKILNEPKGNDASSDSNLGKFEISLDYEDLFN